MTEQIVFFDTYALFEFAQGNSKYQAYGNATGVVTVFNLAEFNYALKKEKDKKTADDLTRKYENLETAVTIEDIIQAMDLKLKHKQLSASDAIGYIVAKRLGIKFLTGDQAFETMENVEYIKK